MRDSFREPGVGGSSDTFNILERGTGIRHCVATTSTDSHETYMALKFFIADRTVKRAYSDNFTSLIKACYDLGIPHELSEPGIHETNAVIERANEDILAGSRVLLVQSGLPSCFWTYAQPCYCMLDNVEPKDNGASSSWVNRHHPEFPGYTIPFVC